MVNGFPVGAQGEGWQLEADVAAFSISPLFSSHCSTFPCRTGPLLRNWECGVLSMKVCSFCRGRSSEFWWEAAEIRSSEMGCGWIVGFGGKIHKE